MFVFEKLNQINLLLKIKENRKITKRGHNLLQMPPFLKARDRIQEILSKDERLNPLNLKKTDYMFIDISMNVPDYVI